jgi:hypothetical protein
MSKCVCCQNTLKALFFKAEDHDPVALGIGNRLSESEKELCDLLLKP